MSEHDIGFATGYETAMANAPKTFLRVEALRAASAIVSGESGNTAYVWDGKNVSAGAFTIALAEQFEGYLSGTIGTDLPKAQQ